jgi:hypothetical protein
MKLDVYYVQVASVTYQCLTDAFPQRHSRFSYVQMIWNIFSLLDHSFIILTSLSLQYVMIYHRILAGVTQCMLFGQPRSRST